MYCLTWFSEPNSEHLEEQQVLLTSEPSLQLAYFVEYVPGCVYAGQRGPLTGVSSLFPQCRFQGSNSGHHGFYSQIASSFIQTIQFNIHNPRTKKKVYKTERFKMNIQYGTSYFYILAVDNQKLKILNVSNYKVDILGH